MRRAVILDGTDVVGLDARRTCGRCAAPKAAMIFQEPSTALNPVFTVGWQLAEGLRAHGKYSKAEAKARAIEMLGRVGIPEPERRVDDYPHQFSGGQKQRIVIAMALALDPTVIVADEPTTALDVTVQAEILELLRDLRDEDGTAIVLITHNMGVVADLADRVAVMFDGEIVETAPATELFAAPAARVHEASCSPRCRGSRSPIAQLRVGATTRRVVVAAETWSSSTPDASAPRPSAPSTA